MSKSHPGGTGRGTRGLSHHTTHAGPEATRLCPSKLALWGPFVGLGWPTAPRARGRRETEPKGEPVEAAARRAGVGVTRGGRGRGHAGRTLRPTTGSRGGGCSGARAPSGGRCWSSLAAGRPTARPGPWERARSSAGSGRSSCENVCPGAKLHSRPLGSAPSLPTWFSRLSSCGHPAAAEAPAGSGQHDAVGPGGPDGCRDFSGLRVSFPCCLRPRLRRPHSPP